jgi:hypothetical protein
MVTERVFWGYLMAWVFGLEVACEAHDGPQSDGASQRAAVCPPNPLEHRLGENMAVFFGVGERREVTEDRLGVSEPITKSPTHGEVEINGRGQHGVTSGQG